MHRVYLPLLVIWMIHHPIVWPKRVLYDLQMVIGDVYPMNWTLLHRNDGRSVCRGYQVHQSFSIQQAISIMCEYCCVYIMLLISNRNRKSTPKKHTVNRSKCLL